MASGYGTVNEAFTVDPRATEGVLARRFFGYLLDIVVICFLWMVLGFLIFILGIITFSLGWHLFALLPLTGIVYNAVTIGGPSQATIGMRAAGVRVVEAATGGRVPMVVAAVHALLFYVAISTFVLWAIDVVVGLARNDRRLGHDLLTGVILVRSP
jgi:uncharacterized RDD family membrane protein YckC